uniref:Uncharacterized protein n=1 Tax=Cacopsylla melanoneura TaxID=428564 RepID=A0A8D9BVG9_9HEMI
MLVVRNFGTVAELHMSPRVRVLVEQLHPVVMGGYTGVWSRERITARVGKQGQSISRGGTRRGIGAVLSRHGQTVLRIGGVGGRRLSGEVGECGGHAIRPRFAITVSE